ncbi:hypothetical protein BD626DRAFT_567547 [Schizophyllum amplum]|uniref:Uncharacterized protein n=1 Tax=Schizophyllum amplum TaxID=97359 RepID=A0A550CIN8_9AGAR|nr:hypothetical protein BD626DRAFT_567547 [Auriculariopsis ampla]
MMNLTRTSAALRLPSTALRFTVSSRRTLTCSSRLCSEPASEDRLLHPKAPETKPGGEPAGEPSGPYSRAGPDSKEYATTSREEPYNEPGKSSRYGNMPLWKDDKGPEESNADEGPDGKASGGRKPEGRKPHNA